MPQPLSPKPMPKCPAPRCLGHADERSAAVVCSRCAGRRWVLVRPRSAPDPDPFTCQRCTAVLAERDALDPLAAAASPAQQAARALAGERLRKAHSSGRRAPEPSPEPSAEPGPRTA
jgi:hypothetical protein